MNSLSSFDASSDKCVFEVILLCYNSLMRASAIADWEWKDLPELPDMSGLLSGSESEDEDVQSRPTVQWMLGTSAALASRDVVSSFSATG